LRRASVTEGVDGKIINLVRTNELLNEEPSMRTNAALLAILILACAAAFVLWKRSDPPVSARQPILPGALCVIPGDDGSFSLAKVLVVEDQTVHVRIYANRWKNRPSIAEVERTKLSMGNINDKEAGFGIGHLPIQKSTFERWKPVVLKVAPVANDELEGYKMWKEGRGGVF